MVRIYYKWKQKVVTIIVCMLPTGSSHYFLNAIIASKLLLSLNLFVSKGFKC